MAWRAGRRHAPRLKTGLLYRYLRHPMYVGVLLGTAHELRSPAARAGNVSTGKFCAALPSAGLIRRKASSLPRLCGMVMTSGFAMGLFLPEGPQHEANHRCHGQGFHRPFLH
jgi:hypothetical protein